jgi:beta-lactamase regulating signal transducer with metallopeptidase domain
MNFMDARTKNALWLFACLCAIAAFILITTFRDAPTPEKPPTVEQPTENRTTR